MRCTIAVLDTVYRTGVSAEQAAGRMTMRVVYASGDFSGNSGNETPELGRRSVKN